MEPKALITEGEEKEVLRQDYRNMNFDDAKPFLVGIVKNIYLKHLSWIIKFSDKHLCFTQKFLVISCQLLNSPWDACFHPVTEKVYIAMAGQHQIWEHNTDDGVTRAFSGDGYERNLNGSR